MVVNLSYHLIAENDLTPDHHRRISDLLMKAFPKVEHIFSQSSYYYALPEYRLWVEDEHGLILAHLDIERRTIAVNGVDVPIAGIGEVATLPDYQGRGLGRLLMDRLKVILCTEIPVDYGFLLCLKEVAGFYERVGWHRVPQLVHEQDIHTGNIQVSHAPALILPCRKTVDEWQTGGVIDIRGLPW